MRFRFIEDHRADYPVRILCEVLGVSPAGYYAWRTRPESRRSAANRDLVDEIQQVHREAYGRYGSPRIHAELRAQGRGASRGRIERLMRHHQGHHGAATPGGPQTAATTSRSRRTCSSGTSQPPRRTGSGSLILLMSRPIRAGSIWPRSWTSTAERSSAGQCAITWAPTCRWQP
jgi:HTH-like domain